MRLLKSTLDGIGTGAGVAWPLFGIVTSILGVGAGSSLALATGSIAGLLFCTISGAVLYWSFKNRQAKELDLHMKLIMKQNALVRTFLLLLHTLYNKYLHDELDVIKPINEATFIDYVKQQLRYTSSALNVFIVSLLQDELTKPLVNAIIKRQQSSALPPHHIQPMLYQQWHQLIIKHSQNLPMRSMSLDAKLRSGVIGFTSAFGAIAGCTAGFMGLLSGLGFTSLTFVAFPMIGLATLGLALVIASVVAADSVYHASEKHHLKSWRYGLKSISKDIKSLHLKLENQLNANRMLSYPNDTTTHQSYGLFKTQKYKTTSVQRVNKERLSETGLEESMRNSIC